jgi:hypothetical protein
MPIAWGDSVSNRSMTRHGRTRKDAEISLMFSGFSVDSVGSVAIYQDSGFGLS